MTGSLLQIVVCTYNNAPMLDRTLAGLAAQDAPRDGSWAVMVVDNNCTDDTPDVVGRHRAAGLVPGLVRVPEPVQGLTPARRRGVVEAAAPWVAFVDDDCLLAPDWVRHALDFARSHLGTAGFGGRVVLDWQGEPTPLAVRHGWCFAAQDRGDQTLAVDFLVGAGMVVNRDALAATGWLDRQYLDDRVGKRLVSGGDVEIALRLAATGRGLWYVPGCVLRHAIPARRTTVRYLMRMTAGLGRSQALADSLGQRPAAGWSAAVACKALRHAGSLGPLALGVLRGRRGRGDLLLAACFAWGRLTGAAGLAAQDLTARLPEFVGCAVPARRTGQNS
ncbi:glycosyltransferase [Aerophototrophica crusticola]|uniref:Glycosyltransferase n=1 Tax=Aerophototrophica crusticola TaxID=1709002 RepID=A0A858R8B6_9PROT|nr:glycosyltransferase [Rhodospirillaceae bacterium B3]